MRRSILLTLTVVVFTTLVVACGSDNGGALDTLPPIFTTTSTTTTTLAPDDRRKFYEVKSGDNLADIAARAGVPAAEIVKLNNLPDNGNYLQVGQIIEIPTNMVLVDLAPSSTMEP
jgi:LysM repeat protein